MGVYPFLKYLVDNFADDDSRYEGKGCTDEVHKECENKFPSISVKHGDCPADRSAREAPGFVRIEGIAWIVGDAIVFAAAVSKFESAENGMFHRHSPGNPVLGMI